MDIRNVIKILSTVSTIVLGIAEIIRQVNIYNKYNNEPGNKVEKH